MLLDGLADVLLGIFDGLPVAVTTWQGRAIGHIALVFGFFLNDNIKLQLFTLDIRVRIMFQALTDQKYRPPHGKKTNSYSQEPGHLIH